VTAGRINYPPALHHSIGPPARRSATARARLTGLRDRACTPDRFVSAQVARGGSPVPFRHCSTTVHRPHAGKSGRPRQSAALGIDLTLGEPPASIHPRLAWATDRRAGAARFTCPRGAPASRHCKHWQCGKDLSDTWEAGGNSARPALQPGTRIVGTVRLLKSTSCFNHDHRHPAPAR
jgi:hypothetical protein